MKLQAWTFSQSKIFRTLDWINSTLASCELQKCKVCIHLVNIMKTPWALASADLIHFVKTSSTKAWFIYHSLIPERWPITITSQKLGKIYMYYITKEEKTHWLSLPCCIRHLWQEMHEAEVFLILSSHWSPINTRSEGVSGCTNLGLLGISCFKDQ